MNVIFMCHYLSRQTMTVSIPLKVRTLPREAAEAGAAAQESLDLGPRSSQVKVCPREGRIPSAASPPPQIIFLCALRPVRIRCIPSKSHIAPPLDIRTLQRRGAAWRTFRSKRAQTQVELRSNISHARGKK